MKAVGIVVLCSLILAASIPGQVKAVEIALKTTLTTPPAYLLQKLPQVGCSNVSIVSYQSDADFLLEALGGDFEGPGGSERAIPRAPGPKAKYTLYQNGVAVFGTTPVKEKNAVKDLCTFLQHGSSK